MWAIQLAQIVLHTHRLGVAPVTNDLIIAITHLSPFLSLLHFFSLPSFFLSSPPKLLSFLGLSCYFFALSSDFFLPLAFFSLSLLLSFVREVWSKAPLSHWPIGLHYPFQLSFCSQWPKDVVSIFSSCL